MQSDTCLWCKHHACLWYGISGKQKCFKVLNAIRIWYLVSPKGDVRSGSRYAVWIEPGQSAGKQNLPSRIMFPGVSVLTSCPSRDRRLTLAIGTVRIMAGFRLRLVWNLSELCELWRGVPETTTRQSFFRRICLEAQIDNASRRHGRFSMLSQTT